MGNDGSLPLSPKTMRRKAHRQCLLLLLLLFLPHTIVHPRLLAPKQAGQHRLNKINRHLRATSRVVGPHLYLLTPLPLLEGSSPCWVGQSSKSSKVYTSPSASLSFWVSTTQLGRIQHLILITMSKVFLPLSLSLSLLFLRSLSKENFCCVACEFAQLLGFNAVWGNL